MAGYATPPLLGLGGAALLAAGKAWPLLWTVVVLLVLALVKAARDTLVPRVVWKASFIMLPLFCRWKSFQPLAP